MEVKEQVEHNGEILQQMINFNDIPEQSTDIPVSTLDSLRSLDEKLENEIEFLKLVRILGLRGGKDAAEATRRVLSCLITNNLAYCLNWQGGEKKRSIKEFQRILQLISVSVRQDKNFADVTQLEIEDAVKRWLRTSCDRDGGRTKRRKLAVDINATINEL